MFLKENLMKNIIMGILKL